MKDRPRELFYIFHLDNLESILQHGILSEKNMEERGFGSVGSIHDEDILVSRRQKKISDGEELPYYVNLFFQPRNSMMYRLMKGENKDRIAVLGIDSSVLDTHGAWISDRNAAAEDAEFFSAEQGLKKLDSGMLGRQFWSEKDGSKQRLMAETLIPVEVMPKDIRTIYAQEKQPSWENQVSKVNIEIHVLQDPNIFFAPTLRRKLNDHIFIAKGDMFFSQMQTLVISVNLQGVMGRGVASRAKYQFPDAYIRYQDHCKKSN